MNIYSYNIKKLYSLRSVHTEYSSLLRAKNVKKGKERNRTEWKVESMKKVRKKERQNKIVDFKIKKI